mgnify:CR=1 FL=1|tara:strand:+ start:287 stop:1117 length:831 start_codon:yes stop_codon:yes gene_type:complete
MLDQLYDKLYSTLEKSKKISSNKSLSLFFVNNVNQKGYKKKFNIFFNDKAALVYYNTSDLDDRIEIDKLSDEGYILKSRSLDNPNSYHITFKGIVEHEKKLFSNIMDLIVSEMDLRMFDNIDYKIDDREKVICYFLLVLGRISNKHKFNFAKGEEHEKRIEKRVLDDFKNISNTLLELGIIKKKLDWAARNQRNARVFISKVDVLPKTEIFKTQNGSWYLDLTNEMRKQVFRELLLPGFDMTNKFLLEDKITEDSTILCLEYELEKPDLSDFLKFI